MTTTTTITKTVIIGLIDENTILKTTSSGPTDTYSNDTSSSSRMRVINHNWSATKQRPHPQSVAEISRHSVLSGDRIRSDGQKLTKKS